jgi:hypothetical protein
MPQQVTQPGSDRWPQFLPDGRHFLFYTSAKGVYAGSLDEPAVHVIDAESAAVFVAPDQLLIPRQGRLLAWRFDPKRATVTGDPVPVAEHVEESGFNRAPFAASATGVLAYRAGGGQRRQLIWVDRSGASKGSVGPPDANWMTSPELSPSDRQAVVWRQVFRNMRTDNDVWLVDVARGLFSPFINDPAQDTFPLFSHDGSRVFFASTRTGSQDLFYKPSNGSTSEERLFTSTNAKSPLSVTADGHVLLYRVLDPKAGLDLWTLRLVNDGATTGSEHSQTQGGARALDIVNTEFDESEGQFSPDREWLAYVSSKSGAPEVYVRAYPGGGDEVRISTNGGTQVRWRRDGNELFYVTPDDRLMAVPIRSGPMTPEVGPAVALFVTHLATGASVVGGKPQYAVASDGRFLMNVAIEQTASAPITVVLNWMAALKR